MKVAVEEERNIPLEIVEEIALNLPVKSLLRFLAVSEAWNTMISDTGFIRRQRTRAAHSGRNRALISKSSQWTHYLVHAATFPLSSMTPNQSIRNQTPLILPFEIHLPVAGIHLLASCGGDLFLVADIKGILLLWNPSMRTYKKLPNPSTIDPDWYLSSSFDFGIGYDSLGDEHKILKWASHECAELYSLRSDSWKKIPVVLPRRSYGSEIVSASGALYWMTDGAVVVSFDLSTEKYAEVVLQPLHDLLRFELGDRMKLSVVRGKLCLNLNYNYSKKYVLWVMEDCNSWVKMLDIDHLGYRLLNLDEDEGGEEDYVIDCLTVLYYYDDCNILMEAKTKGYFHPMIFMYSDEKGIPHQRWYGRRYPNFNSVSRVLFLRQHIAFARSNRRHDQPRKNKCRYYDFCLLITCVQ